ncbi:MAG: ABC transporter ATP-binding protein [Solirubrobacterales bacterium]|nr:ABC transporter ATP-binding protein [Solirubrobacterales bacterium]
MPDALLQVSSASAGYRGVRVVRDVSLKVAASDIALVVGPNGAGKSTLVKAVIGELPLLGGRIEFDGTDVSSWDEERRAVRGLGYVPQARDVFPTLTVTENLEVGGYRLSARECRRAISETFGRFPQLERLRHRKASGLSGGERKLLAIARALMADPKMLILDEPTANLAPKIAHMVLEEVVVGLGKLGRGILLIEQRVALAAAIASQVTVLVDGAVRYSASGEEFRAVPDVSALFFSSEEPAVRGAVRGAGEAAR